MIASNVQNIKRTSASGQNSRTASSRAYGFAAKPASEIWNHFTKIGEGSDWEEKLAIVRCTICGTEMPQGQNSTTKRMWGHVMYRHKDVYQTTKHFHLKQIIKKAKTSHPNGVQEGLAANANADFRSQEDEMQEEEFEDFEKYDQNEGENMLDTNNFDGDEYDNKFSAFAHFGRNDDRSNGSSPPDNNKRELSASPGVERTESPMEHMDMADICGTSGNKDVKDRFNSRIIQLVSMHSALYDFNADGYKSNDIRNKEWDDVAATLGQPTDFVRTRWKTLRDRFKKECRKQQMQNIAPRWHHFEEMLFLAPFIRDRPSDFMFLDDSGLEYGQSNSAPGFQSASQGAGANKSQRRPVPSNGENVNRSESNTNYILDFAMNVVANGNTDSLESPPGNNDDSNAEWNENSERNAAAKVITTFERPFNFEDYQPGQSQQGSNSVQRDHSDMGRKRANDEGREKNRDERQEYGNKRARMDQHSSNRSGTFSQNDDEEDVLFCKIMLKKMQRMSEHTKEKAKAKIMELLVQFQYGEIS
ncbi:alcohol dehydrogenase transcription factor myb/SANT-like domain-containing protein [Ditylenchus destructor]|uniref:Alcohol dehydrogenase transcription factor myb/SANT-like domain-containing protein n=1 Tax=Ditylenchus destructor TaxID=166010 RepID=A0AAD4MLX9_9BILA|nr:alcohol dehydrogenase transcription factor myb/SANT-like domain-containing protein [Ditylenchus destructor]